MASTRGLWCRCERVIICIWRQIMRTTLNLDDEALRQAMKSARGMTKTKVINQALLEYARRRRLRGFLRLRGKLRWEGDLDVLRGRVRSRG
jgi:Arc/MetJ family transcription regulator